MRIEHPASGSAVDIEFEVITDHGEIVCGVFGLKGRVNLPPRQWLAIVRTTMAEIEQRARAAGAVEMRVAGRDWSRVLPDYEPLEGKTPNLLRKRL